MIRFAPFAAILTLAACMQPQDGAGFDGSYRLVSIDGKAIAGTADMTIAGASVRGEAPCNSYRTTNASAWPDVALAPIATTRRACFAEAGEAEFLAAMANVTRAEPVKGGMELSGPTHRLRFAVQP